MEKLNSISFWLLLSLVIFTGCKRQESVGAQTVEGERKTESQLNVSTEIEQGDLWSRKSGLDWPTFLGPNGESISSETGILKDWTQGKLKLVWKIKTGAGYGMGSVVDGRFYHFGRINNKATLLCLKAETGETLWDFSYPSDYRDLYGYDSGPRASPVIDDGKVYIYGVEGHLHCLDAVSGEPLWDVQLNEKFGVIQNFFGVASTPVICKDLLLVMVGGSPDRSKRAAPGALDEVEPDHTGLVALNKKTGKIIYQSINDLASYSSLKLTQFNDQPVLLAWMRGSLFGVKPQTGKVAFEFPWRSKKLESVNASMPVVIDEHVLISECYEIGSALLKLNPSSDSPELLDAEVVWNDKGKRDTAMMAHWNTPVVMGDLMFGCSGRHVANAELRCIDWKTGKVHWSETGLTRTSMLLIDGHLIVHAEDGKLFLIKASKDKFELVTSYRDPAGVEFQQPCWAAPIVSHGLLFVRGRDTLACFDLIPTSE